MKIIYFLDQGVATVDDHAGIAELRAKGHKVTFANGSIEYGFQDSCDAIVMSKEFAHIKAWADATGKEILHASDGAESDKPKRARKPKQDQEQAE